MRVLVTGGAGRLGTRVCRLLLEDGFQVRLLDLECGRTRRSIRKLGGKVEVLWGDVRRPDTVRQALQDVDAVAHMAALLPPTTDQQPGLAEETNVGGTRVVVDVVRENGGKIPLVYTSSVSVFGATPDATEPLCPEKNGANPQEPYAHTKVQSEELIKESGIDYVILRMTSAMDLDTSAMKLMYRVPLDNRIAFCHPDDICLAIVNAIKNFDAVRGETLVIAGDADGRMIYGGMLGGALAALGLPLPPARRFSRTPYCIDWYDTSRSQALLNYQQKTFADFCRDIQRSVAGPLSPIVAPLLRYFIGPVFGWLIVRLI
jgi:UDP-glucose 4-epimerase